MNRREFLSQTATGAAGLVVASTIGAGAVQEKRGRSRPVPVQAVVVRAWPGRVGTYYEAEVPDTLDLAERARLGVNHFTELIREDKDYEMLFGGGWRVEDGTVGMGFHMTGIACCQAKCMEALVMERIMSGSPQNLDRETKMVEMMVSHIGDEGIWWVPREFGVTEKPWLGAADLRPYANTHGQGRMFRAIIAWYQYTGDAKWKALLDRMTDGLDRLFVVHKPALSPSTSLRASSVEP